MKTYQFFTNGEWRDPACGEWFESTDPTTGKPWCRIPRCTAEDVDVAVQAAYTAFHDGPWRQMSARYRAGAILRMADALVRHADQLGDIETRDNGKRTADITPGLKTWLADSLTYNAGLVDKIEGSVIPVGTPDMLNYTVHEPFGPVACITAWNSPLLIAIWKIAPALAAGNTVILKPSEYASASTLTLMEAMQEADLPLGVLNCVTGFGEEAGASLVAHPNTRLVSFTGGVPGGAKVATLAAQGIKPVIMELGGKSPQIVLEDADLDVAADGIAAGIFSPSGQSCIAGSRMLVHESLHDEMVERLCTIVAAAKLGHPSDPTVHIGPIANGPHFDRILADIEAAKSEGAKLVSGGTAIRPADAPDGWFIPPTIFTDVTPDMTIARKEVFGPVLAVLPFETEAEAVRIANDTDFGLAAGIWTQNTGRAIQLANKIGAGTVYINNYFDSAPQSPVGGFKMSGYGRENGVEGLNAFLQTKSIWLSTNPKPAGPFQS